jgi:DNA polymerase III sliding clamp (beta) subunit (PCNA family)
VALNGHFLLDALELMDAERVRLGLTGPTTPAAVTLAVAGEPLTVIAPVRTYD